MKKVFGVTKLRENSCEDGDAIEVSKTKALRSIGLQKLILAGDSLHFGGVRQSRVMQGRKCEDEIRKSEVHLQGRIHGSEFAASAIVKPDDVGQMGGGNAQRSLVSWLKSSRWVKVVGAGCRCVAFTRCTAAARSPLRRERRGVYKVSARSEGDWAGRHGL